MTTSPPLVYIKNYPIYPWSWFKKSSNALTPTYYAHNPPSTLNNHKTSPLSLITWNTRHITSSLPCIEDLLSTLHNAPQIILKQEIKILTNKSTTYLAQRFPYYKNTYNNSNTTIPHKVNQYATPTPTKGVLLIMIHKAIYFNENIKKIPTPNTILPYRPTFKIGN